MWMMASGYVLIGWALMEIMEDAARAGHIKHHSGLNLCVVVTLWPLIILFSLIRSALK